MKQRGFIALMTVIILSVVLLGLASTANTAGYFSRFNQLERESKREAFALAESCANIALLNLAQNYTYTPLTPTTIVVGADSCIIQSIADGAPNPNSRTVTITTSASYHSSFSTLKVEATIANPAAGAGVQPVLINSSEETN